MHKTEKDYKKIIEDLRSKYDECSQTLNAIRSGNVDAIVMQDGKTDKIYTLKDAQYPYRIMVENMNEGAVTISADGLIFYCNRQVSSILGIPLEKFIGRNISDFIKKSDHSKFNYFLKNLKNKESKIEVELTGRSEGKGEEVYIPVLISGNILVLSGRKLFIIILTDLREHRKQEKILRSEWFSRRILEQSADIIIVTDPDGMVLRTSMKAFNIFRKQKRLNDKWHVDIFLTDFHLVLKNKKGLNDKKTGESLSFSSIISNKINSGSEIELYRGKITRNFLIRHNIINDDNQMLGYSISLAEITKLKRAEKKLKESETKYKTLFESMSQPFILGEIIYDEKNDPVDYIFLEANRSWEEISNIPREKIIGKRAYNVFPNLAPKWLKFFGEVAVNKSAVFLDQYASISKKWFNVLVYSPQKNHFAAILEDITERKKAEKTKVRMLHEKILKIERKKIARELHDTVTQYLFSSNLFAESISKYLEKDPQKALKNLEEVRDLNSAALSEIQILLYNLMPERISNIHIKELIEKLVNLVKKQSNIKFDLIVEGNNDFDYRIKHEVYRIAQEALTNIVKHSEATQVKINLKLFPDEQKIVISDDGKGFNINNKTVKKRFGLTIMKERAKLVGASLDIKTNHGIGTRITLLKKYKKSKSS